jgi:hypothetical protein
MYHIQIIIYCNYELLQQTRQLRQIRNRQP